MKLIYAGNNIEDWNEARQSFQYNCTRNRACQKAYMIPIKQYSDMVFYVDLPGKPLTIESVFVNTCMNSSELSDHEGTIVWGRYIVGQKPDGSWYGVFGNPTILPNDNWPTAVPKCFFVYMIFELISTPDGINHHYISEEICLQDCRKLSLVRACYPNEPVGADAFDGNDWYFGYPTTEDYAGDPTYRYFHSAYVRDGEVVTDKVSLSITAFNRKTAYKSVTEKERIFMFEMVPDFYKDELLAIFQRGNIYIDTTQYLLAEDQEFTMLDHGAKLWQMDVRLTEEIKQFFGCNLSDCEPICAGRPTGVEFDELEGNYVFTFTGGTFADGNTIEYEIREQETNTLIQSGTIEEEPLQFTVNVSEHPTFDPDEECYIVIWRKCCSEALCTDYTSQEVGNCETSPCEEAGFQIIGGTEPVYAALYWSANEVDYSNPAEPCGGGGATYPVPGLGWKVYLAFYQDAALTIPINVTLSSYSVVVNALPYVISGTGHAFFIADFQRESYSLSPIDCSLEGPFINDLPTLSANDCFTVEEIPGEGIGAGKLKMARAGDDPLPGPRMNAAIQISMGTSGPNTLEEMETTEEITLNAFYGLVMYQFETPGSHAGSITITDGVETEVIPGPFFSIGISQPWSISTKKFIIDDNHDITVTFDQA